MKILKRILANKHIKDELKLYSVVAVLFASSLVAVYFFYIVYKGKVEKRTFAPPTFMGAILKTNYGNIEIEFNARAPKAVANFIKLTESGFYEGTKFHRIITNFMIEGGDPLTKSDELVGKWGNGGPGYVFDDEINAGDEMVRGTVAMVNNGPNTNGSQFFILSADASWLNNQNTIFAHVKSGLEIVDEIAKIGSGVTGIPLSSVNLEKVILR